MPHLILEHSNNLKNFSPLKFFKESHAFLEQYTEIESCKSRRVICDDFYIGEGSLENSFFAHLTILLIPGRSDKVLQNIGTTLQGLLKKHLDPIIGNCNLKGDVTAEIRNLNFYFKI